MSLDQLPDEIIHHILYFLSPWDTLYGIQLASRRFSQLSNEPLIWRFHCIHSFTYWHPRHNFPARLRLPVIQVDWKRLFLLRDDRNKRISRLLEDVIKTKVNRWKKFGQICEFGYDAKDFLLAESECDNSLDDVLARRYFAQTILDGIHRSIAIEQWINLPRTVEMSTPLELERALGSFDLFVLHGKPGDLDDISHRLDGLIVDFESSHPKLNEWTTRQKALALNKWVRLKNLTGLRFPERDYRNLRNCLIGQALKHEDHESIPIISSAIFCCLAYRIGLEAQCCAFPSHVHVVVSPPPGLTLDHNPVVDSSKRQDRMYLDPFGSDLEVPAAELQGILDRFGWQSRTEAVMSPVPTALVVNRTAANIRATYGLVLEQRDRAPPELTQLLHGPSTMNLAACYYASLWSSLILTPPSDFEWEELLEKFLDRFARAWPEDAWLVEKYLMPLHDNFAALHRNFIGLRRDAADDAWGILRLTQQADALPPLVFRRTEAGNTRVPFKIGQVFQHARYGWQGVITGWTDHGTRSLTSHAVRPTDESIDTGEEASDTDVINRLRRAANKTYFTYIRSTTAERYVIADGNIEIVEDVNLVREPFLFAGKFFKRFDPKTCRFVSNMKEQYPDD